MLRVEQLSKSFGGVRAVDRCSFTIAPKRITALIGPNGAGKTTVFACVSGLLTPDSGRVLLGDRDFTMMAPWDRARLGLSRTFQQVRLWQYLTIEEHLLLAQHANDDRVASVFRSDSDAQRAAARAALDRVGLPHELLDRLGGDLSYGQSKLLELARALLWLETVRMYVPLPLRMVGEREGKGGRGAKRSAAARLSPSHSPSPQSGEGEERVGILLLDEPVAGVNPVLRLQIAEILQQLRADGETILVIEHDMDFVRSVADHVIVMAEGRVLLEGTPDEVLAHPDVIEAYLGVEAGITKNQILLPRRIRLGRTNSKE